MVEVSKMKDGRKGETKREAEGERGESMRP